MFAEAATLAAADVAGNVHFCRRLCEGEVRRAQANLRVRAEHLAGESEQHLFQVGERHILVDVQALHLVEEAVRARRDGLVAIHTPRANHANRGRRVFHHAALHARSVRAQDHIGMRFHEESVLHVACRMIFGKVHCAKHMPVVFDLRTVGERKAHASEDVDDLLLHERERVACSQSDGVGRARQVQCGVIVLRRRQLLLQGVETVLERRFELVEVDAHLLLLVGSHVAELRHKLVHLSFLAQEFEAQLFELLFVLGLQLSHAAEQCFDFFYHCEIDLFRF